jgi:DNA-binding transcriptional MocR family regulator
VISSSADQVLAAGLSAARDDYAALQAQGLSLDLTRGKPSGAQLDLAAALLNLPGGEYIARDGTDCRNYGGSPLGLAELREIFSPVLHVPVEQLMAVGNSSLELMHDCLVHALLGQVPGAERRWADESPIAFICPVPGYDRHFALCERFGIEMVPVPMTADGPDLDQVEELVADPRIKGMWCVPRYSNPDGTCYSDTTVRRLAGMRAGAPDFRIFWDDAYAVHHLTDTETDVADILAACAGAGHPDRAFVFGSTSKVTLGGAGVAFFGSSPANVDWLLACSSKRSIGPDKLSQLRHAIFLRDGDGLRAHMRAHREILRPKFDTVRDVLSRELDGTGLASWSDPRGGYFITLSVLPGCAREVVRLAAGAGIAVTPAGATHPYGNDPADSLVRIAPTYPPLADLAQIAYGLTVCVRLAGYELLARQRGTESQAGRG